MGRKRKNAIQIYISDDELALLNERVKECGFHSKSEFLRKGIIDGILYVIDTDGIQNSLQGIAVELRKIGVNVNQIAAKANSTGLINKREIEEIKQAQRKIWSLLEEKMSALP